MVLKYCKSQSVFEACGKEEYEIISTRMKAYIGSSFLPYGPLLEHIHFKVLIETREANCDDRLDHGGTWPISIKIRSFADRYKTIQYIIIHEIFTELLMEEKCIDYKEAATELYNGQAPTTHHKHMLLNDMFLNVTTIKDRKRNITVQLVEGNIANQFTHCILNITDKHLLNDGEVSELLVRVGGSGVRNACDIYVEKNGLLNVGEVISLSPGKLKCHHLYHSAQANVDQIDISTI